MCGPRAQRLTELDPETTVTSIDGIGAYDTISRLQQADDTALLLVPIRVLVGRQRGGGPDSTR